MLQDRLKGGLHGHGLGGHAQLHEAGGMGQIGTDVLAGDEPDLALGAQSISVIVCSAQQSLSQILNSQTRPN